MKIALEAEALADQFNERLARCSVLQEVPVVGELPVISVVKPSVKRIKSSGTYRYLSVEPFLEGAYTKFNGNNGFVASQQGLVSSQQPDMPAFLKQEVPQTFTHWTYEHTLAASGSALMVCDIQGVGFQYTDVTLCSEDRRFGKTDLGSAGFLEFFGTHRCNMLCRCLELTRCEPSTGGVVASRNTATSAIEIMRTKHLSKRKRERGIETRDIQAAIKHGKKQSGAVAGSVTHCHNGVVVVTDTDHRVGVTAFKTPY